jgi:curved DNA-binding protein CbpA
MLKAPLGKQDRREGDLMAKPGNGQPEPDPYQLLGVARQATPAEIAQAWRRRARAEHPDARPGDASAAARFRALVGAYELLSDPARRAAWDQGARVPEPGPRAPRPAAGTAVAVIVLSPSGLPAAPEPARGAPLRAGPVRVEPPGGPSPRGAACEQRARLVLLAEMAARYLDDMRERPW